MAPSETRTGCSVSDAQPPTLNHFIGNTSIVERVRIALDAMFNERSNGGTPPSMLFLGPKGLGKTLLAQIIAREAGLTEKYTETLGQAIQSRSSLNGLILDADSGILFIDEIHSLNSTAQLDLLKAVDQKRIYLQPGQDADTPPCEISIGNFCLIGATTEEYGLLPPLVDRFKLILRFDYYSTEDLCKIVEQRARALGWRLSDGLIEEISRRGKQTPRIALRLLESCWRTAKAGNSDIITPEHFQRTVRLEQLDSLGCDSAEQTYLRFLKESEGKARLNVIASRLGLPTRTVEGLEQFLIRKELISKNETGLRVLTAKGVQHIHDNRI